MNYKNPTKPFCLPAYLLSSLIVLFLSAQLAFADEDLVLSESDLVGSWNSSKAETIIEIKSDGTWHIAEWDQSGWWALIDSNKFVWMYYEDSTVEDADDINQILSYKKNEFTLRESDDTLTIFSREK